MFGVSQIVGALLMYGIGQANVSIHVWRIMFFVCGGLTIAVGIAFVVLMPKNTNTAWFLNERERQIATERLAVDRATRDRAHFDNAQLREALTDPRTALYAALALFITIPTPITKVCLDIYHAVAGKVTNSPHSSLLWSSTDLAILLLRLC
jgi:MFS transporter, ACS family, allantoate permease